MINRQDRRGGRETFQGKGVVCTKALGQENILISEESKGHLSGINGIRTSRASLAFVKILVSIQYAMENHLNI